MRHVAAARLLRTCRQAVDPTVTVALAACLMAALAGCGAAAGSGAPSAPNTSVTALGPQLAASPDWIAISCAPEHRVFFMNALSHRILGHVVLPKTRIMAKALMGQRPGEQQALLYDREHHTLFILWEVVKDSIPTELMYAVDVADGRLFGPVTIGSGLLFPLLMVPWQNDSVLVASGNVLLSVSLDHGRLSNPRAVLRMPGTTAFQDLQRLGPRLLVALVFDQRTLANPNSLWWLHATPGTRLSASKGAQRGVAFATLTGNAGSVALVRSIGNTRSEVLAVHATGASGAPTVFPGGTIQGTMAVPLGGRSLAVVPYGGFQTPGRTTQNGVVEVVDLDGRSSKLVRLPAPALGAGGISTSGDVLAVMLAGPRSGIALLRAPFTAGTPDIVHVCTSPLAAT